MEFNAWNGFQSGEWQQKINVRDFIDKNYTPYEGDGAFLAGPTERTKRALAELERLKALEQEKGGVLDIDTTTVSSLCNYAPGHLIDDDLIVGFQTDSCLFAKTVVGWDASVEIGCLLSVPYDIDSAADDETLTFPFSVEGASMTILPKSTLSGASAAKTSGPPAKVSVAPGFRWAVTASTTVSASSVTVCESAGASGVP